jgi:hypothetical protein
MEHDFGGEESKVDLDLLIKSHGCMTENCINLTT